MAIVTQNHKTNLLKYPTAPTVKECSCQQSLIAHLLKNAYQNANLVYHAEGWHIMKRASISCTGRKVRYNPS